MFSHKTSAAAHFSSAIRRWVYARPELFEHGLTKRRRRFDYRMDSGCRCLLLYCVVYYYARDGSKYFSFMLSEQC